MSFTAQRCAGGRWGYWLCSPGAGLDLEAGRAGVRGGAKGRGARTAPRGRDRETHKETHKETHPHETQANGGARKERQ